MNKSTRTSGISDDWQAADAPVAAKSLQNDFNGLIEIFDRHLAALSPEDGMARKHISQARAAAERGLRLSRELVELVKAPG